MASPNPPTARALPGGLGTVVGVTGFDGAERTPVPAAFVAVTVNVCTVRIGRPPTVHVTAPVVVHVCQVPH